ncbi:MAG: zinc ribbon domain-containing protein [Haloarculaceae archaeon]
MGVIETFKSLVSGGEQTYSYECRDCGRAFESSANHPRDATCPGCGSDDVRTSI